MLGLLAGQTAATLPAAGVVNQTPCSPSSDLVLCGLPEEPPPLTTLSVHVRDTWKDELGRKRHGSDQSPPHRVFVMASVVKVNRKLEVSPQYEIIVHTPWIHSSAEVGSPRRNEKNKC